FFHSLSELQLMPFNECILHPSWIHAHYYYEQRKSHQQIECFQYFHYPLFGTAVQIVNIKNNAFQRLVKIGFELLGILHGYLAQFDRVSLKKLVQNLKILAND